MNLFWRIALVMAILFDLVTSIWWLESGKMVEANPWLAHIFDLRGSLGLCLVKIGISFPFAFISELALKKQLICELKVLFFCKFAFWIYLAVYVGTFVWIHFI